MTESENIIPTLFDQKNSHKHTCPECNNDVQECYRIEGEDDIEKTCLYCYIVEESSNDN